MPTAVEPAEIVPSKDIALARSVLSEVVDSRSVLMSAAGELLHKEVPSLPRSEWLGCGSFSGFVAAHLPEFSRWGSKGEYLIRTSPDGTQTVPPDWPSRGARSEAGDLTIAGPEGAAGARVDPAAPVAKARPVRLPLEREAIWATPQLLIEYAEKVGTNEYLGLDELRRGAPTTSDRTPSHDIVRCVRNKKSLHFRGRPLRGKPGGTGPLAQWRGRRPSETTRRNHCQVGASGCSWECGESCPQHLRACGLGRPPATPGRCTCGPQTTYTRCGRVALIGGNA